MAETPNESVSKPSESLIPGDAFPSSTPAPTPEAHPGRDSAYRPLSLLALLSLIAAIIYSGFVVIAGLAAFFTKSPFLLPAWTLMFPLGIVMFGWIARTQILGSEGTRSGLALTKWAIGMGLVVGLTYGAYYAATYVAITRQAEAFAEEWLEKIKKDELDEAFWMSVTPPRREQKNLRETLEVLHNAGLGPNRGPYSMFPTFDFVKLLSEGGESAKYEFLGVESWEHVPEGYQVKLNYTLSSRFGHVNVVITVLGKESPTGEYRGRQWKVELMDSGPFQDTPDVVWSEEGKRLNEIGKFQVTPFVELWINDLRVGDEFGFLATVPHEKRGVFEKNGAKWLAEWKKLGMAGAFGAAKSKEQIEYLQARASFEGDGIVTAREGVFWSDSAIRDRILGQIARFRQGKITGMRPIRPEPKNLLPFEKKGDKITTMDVEVQFEVPNDQEGKPPFRIEAVVHVDISKGADDPRILSMDLIRATTAPNPTDVGGQGIGPAGGGPG